MKAFFDFLYMGGYYFTLPLTAFALVILFMAVRAGLELFVAQRVVGQVTRKKLDLILYLGGFSFIFGLLGQMIGMYSAFEYISKVGNISPKMLAGGLKVSMVTTLYGTVILLMASVLWYILRRKLKGLLSQEGQED